MVPGEKDAKLAQKLGQLQPFMGRPNTFLDPQNSCSISNISNPLDCGDNFVGFACAGLNTACPYFYEELAAWKARAPQR